MSTITKAVRFGSIMAFSRNPSMGIVFGVVVGKREERVRSHVLLSWEMVQKL